MRRLAGALGAGAMSLYYYVASKEELLDAMIDVVFGEIELPPEDRLAVGDATAVGIRPTGSRTPPVGDRPDGRGRRRGPRTSAITKRSPPACGGLASRS